MLDLSRSVFRYQGKKPDDSEIEKELLALAARKPRWGFGKMLAWLFFERRDVRLSGTGGWKMPAWMTMEWWLSLGRKQK